MKRCQNRFTENVVENVFSLRWITELTNANEKFTCIRASLATTPLVSFLFIACLEYRKPKKTKVNVTYSNHVMVFENWSSKRAVMAENLCQHLHIPKSFS